MKQQSRWTLAWTASVFMLAAVCAHSQDNVNWTGEGADNLWSTDANWDPNPPAAEDSADFDLDDTYQVDFDDDAEVAELLLKQGDVTFDLDENTLTAGALHVANNTGTDAALLFTGGTLVSETVDLGRQVTGTLVFRGAGTIWTNTGPYLTSWNLGTSPGKALIEIGDEAQAVLSGINIGTGHGSASELKVTGDGTAVTFTDRVRSYRGTHEINVEAGATMTLHEYYLAGGASTNTITIDASTLNLAVDGQITLGYNSGAVCTLTLKNGAQYNDTAGNTLTVGRIGSGTLTVESGSALVKPQGTVNVGIGNAAARGLLLVRDGGTVDIGEELRFRTSENPAIRVHTQGVLRVAGNLHTHDDNTGVLDITGEQALLETENLWLGLRVDEIIPRGGVDMTVADGGSVTVTNMLRVGSLSTLSIDAGTVEADKMELLVDGDGSALLAVNLHTGGTDTMISVSGEAAVDGADFALALADGFESEQGEIFTIIEAGTLTNEFNGIEENDVIAVGDYYQFRASYEDDSFTLTTMPPSGTIITIF